MAVGDVLRRLTSKCLAYSVSQKAAQLLRPLQFGVGVRGGCEAVVHATRATLAREDVLPSQKWSLQVDFENGFNLNNRTKMIEAIRQYFPELSPWVECSYGTTSFLVFG